MSPWLPDHWRGWLRAMAAQDIKNRATLTTRLTRLRRIRRPRTGTLDFLLMDGATAVSQKFYLGGSPLQST